jgi:RNA polymerase sigma-70 factor, ECF subfamily
MSLGPERGSSRLEQFRAYLMVMARLHWDQRLQGKTDPADLVQQTLLEAHQKLHQFRGNSDPQLMGWLRVSLVHNLLDALKKFVDPRDGKPREAQLLDAMEESSSRLQALLAADQSSPSERASNEEELLRLTAALEQLPEAQREAVTLNRLKGMSAADVARRLGRTEDAVAGLLRRGLKKLRELLRESE